MALRDWFSRKTRLQLALERGSQPGADLAHELRALDDYSVSSRKDAEAICDALRQLVNTNGAIESGAGFRALVRLFQRLESGDCHAFPVLAEHGVPLVARVVTAALRNPSLLDADEVLFALKILAMYGTEEGTDVVLQAARAPLRPDSYMWSVIVRPYSPTHPESERLFRELSDPLPGEFLAVALMDAANTAKLEGADFPHPFDSPAGIRQLERWLSDDVEEHFSYAVSATAALPFISASERDSLLSLAFDHPSPDVQLEAAWAAASLGREAGIRALGRACLDVNLADRARRYLNDLGRTDAIPPEAEDASFQAQADFAQWLAHPNELGRPPDELEIVDHRELNWPPSREPKSLWLIRYRMKDTNGLEPDQVDVGLVGSVTFCLFGYKLDQRPPEDCYAIHCYWELTCHELIAEIDVPDNSREYDQMLSQCRVDGLDSARISVVVELAPELKYPQNIVALAKATRFGEPGWIVLDGSRSRWYAASEMPAESSDNLVLMVHVGRVLLGFDEEPDRRGYLQPAAAPLADNQIIAAYEKLLNKAGADSRQAKKLLGGFSILGSAFSRYVAALAACRSQSPAACTCEVYERLLSAVALADPALQEETHEPCAPLGETFQNYVEALVELNRQAEVPALVETFRPYWKHNFGYVQLGQAAYKAGHDQLAESLFLTLRDSEKDSWRFDAIGSLAEIWKRQGRDEEAHRLLIDAMKKAHEASQTATGNDGRLIEDAFLARRSTYRQLFPDRGDAELRRHGIPPTTLAEETERPGA